MQDARATPPRLLAALGAIVVYFLIQLAAGVLVGLAFALVHGDAGSAAQVRALLRNPHERITLVVTSLPVSCVLSVLVFRFWFRRPWRGGGNLGIGIRPIRVPAFAMQLLLGMATLLLGGMLTLLVTGGHPPMQDVRQIMGEASLPLRLALALTAVVLVPLVEEILFRGILLPSLLRHMPVLAAVSMDAVLFALVHLPDFGFKPGGLLALALLGGVCCWRRLKTGSIYAAVAVHAGNNLLAMLALVLARH